MLPPLWVRTGEGRGGGRHETFRRPGSGGGRRVIRRIHTGLGLLVSVLLLWLVLRSIGLASVWDGLLAARWGLLVPALALYFVGVGIRAVRWQVLLAPLKPVPARRLFPIITIGYMANDVLPARLGEVVRVYVLGRREGVSRAAALATVLVERVFDGLCLLVFVGITLPLVAPTGAWQGLFWAAAALFGVTALVLVAIAGRPSVPLALIEPGIRLLPGGVHRRARDLVAGLVSGLAVLGGVRGSLSALGLSVLAWLCEAGLYLVLLSALAIEGPPLFPLALLTTGVANLGTLIPSSPGYVGVFHYLVQQVLTQAGVALSQATVYAVLVHAALIVPVTLVGLYHAWRLGLTLDWLRAAGRPAAVEGSDRAASIARS